MKKESETTFYKLYGNKLNNDEKESFRIMCDVFDYRCSYGTEKSEVADYLYSYKIIITMTITNVLLIMFTSCCAILYILSSFSPSLLTNIMILSITIMAVSMILSEYISIKKFIFDVPDYLYFNKMVNDTGIEMTKMLNTKFRGKKWD